MRTRAGNAPAARRKRGNLLGFVAILTWSVYPLLIVAGQKAPPFLFLAVAFTVAASFSLLRRGSLAFLRGEPPLAAITGLIRETPRRTLALGCIGLFGSNALFNLALRWGVEPVSATIVMSTWPIMMAGIVLCLGLARATWWDALALGAGFAGILVMSGKEGGFHFEAGLLLAALSGFCWALYSGARRLVPDGPTDALGAYALVSAIASWTLHLALGEPMIFDTQTLIAMLAAGLLPMGIGNVFWDLGTREGDPVLLAGLSFLEPALATFLLLFYLLQWPLAADLAGLALVMIGAGLGVLGERQRRRRQPS
jgi:drug/metabolite transporter (DMT)-like permease